MKESPIYNLNLNQIFYQNESSKRFYSFLITCLVSSEIFSALKHANCIANTRKILQNDKYLSNYNNRKLFKHYTIIAI